jgi:hypothetical protein
MRRKLHAWELEHLRQHVEELRAALDVAEQERDEAMQRASWAEDCADRWRDDALQAIEQAGQAPGLTMAGHIVAAPPPAPI